MTDFGRELREHWPILVIATLLIFFAFGIPNYTMPFIYSGAAEEFGWSRVQVTALASVKYLTGAAAALVVGRLLDVCNPRRIVMVATAVGGLAMMSFFVATRLSIYYAAGLALGLSASGITVSMKILVSNVFERAQGTAIAIVLTGTSLGGVIAPIVVAPLIERYGWRPAMLILSGGIWFVAIPAWLWMCRGRLATTKQETQAISPAGPHTSLWQHFKALSGDREFWMIAISVFLIGAADIGMLQNQVLFLQIDKGLDLKTVAWATSMLAAIGVVAKIAFGGFYDRYSIRGIMFSRFMIAVSILLALPVAGVMSMVLFMSVRGFAHGGFQIDIPVLTKHCYGREHLGLNIGILSAFLQVGMAIGPPALGAAYDAQGSYGPGFLCACAASFVAALLLAPVKPRFWTKPGLAAAQHGEPATSRSSA